MKKITIIIPCAGKSSRYPNLRPKFLLVNPNGNLMLIDSIAKLNRINCNLVVTVLKEHAEKYDIQKMFDKFFPDYKIKLCILEHATKGQSETVYQTLKKMNINGPFLIKDSDNVFCLDNVIEDFNYISAERLDRVGMINPANKSYVSVDTSGIVTGIEEKKIVSDTFSVGGYYFTNPQDFINAFDELTTDGLDVEMYVSLIINHLIFNKQVRFMAKYVSKYSDFGTITEWYTYKNNNKTYFIDIDGVVVKNSGEYWKPYWGTTSGIVDNIKLIRELYSKGNMIIFTTTRKESYRAITIKQLEKLGVKYHQLVMGLYHSQRVIINDFSSSNPYPCVVAVNIPRDSNNLSELLR